MGRTLGRKKSASASCTAFHVATSSVALVAMMSCRGWRGTPVSTRCRCQSSSHPKPPGHLQPVQHGHLQVRDDAVHLAWEEGGGGREGVREGETQGEGVNEGPTWPSA